MEENSETIINIIKTNKELLTIKSGHENIEWSPYIQENSKFKPFVPPGGKNKSMRLLFCNVQTHVYSNVLRLWSLFHVILLLLIWIFLQLNINIYIVVLIIWILTIDIFMFEILGSNPFSFLSTLSTIIIWKRRGNAVTSIPYKVVFFIYLNALIKILYDIHFVSINSVNTNVNKILILSAIVNSSMLALTRFWPSTAATRAAVMIFSTCNCLIRNINKSNISKNNVSKVATDEYSTVEDEPKNV